MISNLASRYIIIVLFGVVVFIAISKLMNCLLNSEINNLEVTLTAKVLHDDVFQILYWEKGDKKFTKANSVSTKVSGSAAFQDINFILPSLIDLYKLRLDIGEGANQKNVIIQSFLFKSDKGENKFNANEFIEMFLPNKHIKLNGGDSYTGLTVVKNQKSYYDPYFVSKVDSYQMKKIIGVDSVFYAYLGGLFASFVFMLFLLKNQERILIGSSGVFIIIFIMLLVIPTLQKNIGFVKKAENLEKRKLAEKPEFAFTQKFAKHYGAYLDDNFGLRNQLVHWGANLKTKIFRSSVYPEKVMLGKNKWLFYNHFKNNIVKSYSHENLLTNDTLKLLINQWEQNKKVFEEQGRKYLLVFWPNKHTIYPEFLPSSMRMQIKDTVSRVDQIIAYMNQQNSAIALIDVRPKLKSTKKDFQLYHKFDTHWNDYGAFIGYQSFFNQAYHYLGVTPKLKDEFDIKWSTYSGGDLIPMLGINNNGFFEEQQPKFTLRNEKDQIEYLSVDEYPIQTVRTVNQLAGNKLKALVFCDSYSKSIIQFFSLHFLEVTYIRNHEESFINKLNPDIIIDCFVEREIGEKHTIKKL